MILNKRRIRGDLIQKYKIENNLDEIEWHFKPIRGHVRTGHRSKYQREVVKSCYQGYNFFNNRIASKLNKLPDEIITANSLNSFKNKMFNLMVNIKNCHRPSSTVDVPSKGLIPFATQLLLLLLIALK